MVESEISPLSERPSHRAQIYDHIFFPHKWVQLPRLDSRNLVLLPSRIWTSEQWQDDYAAAVSAGNGFAHRIDFPYPDKTIIGLEFSWIHVSPDEPKISLREVGDLLNQGERIGGTASKLVDYFDPTLPGGVLESILRNDSPSERLVSVIGILDENNRPKGLIMYAKGHRPRGGKKVPVVTTKYSPLLQPT